MKAASGNVLFYILIAVALFAALSYTVAQSGRGVSGSSMTRESDRLRALEFVDYASGLHSAVSLLRARGCAEEEISFENDFSSANYTNPHAPSDERCHVFSLRGGAVNYNNAYDQVFTGSYIISGLETDLIVDIRVDLSTCQALNDVLNINAGEGAPLQDKLSAGVPFQGDYTIAPTASSNQRIIAEIYREKGTGCRTNSGSGNSAVYQYHSVLISR